MTSRKAGNIVVAAGRSQNRRFKAVPIQFWTERRMTRHSSSNTTDRSLGPLQHVMQTTNQKIALLAAGDW